MEKTRKGIFTEFIQGLREIGQSFFSSEDNIDEKTLNEATEDTRKAFAKAYANIEKSSESSKKSKKPEIIIDTDKAVNKVKNNRSEKEKGREIGDD